MSEFKLKQTAEEVQRAVDNGLSFGDMPTGGDTLYWDGNTEGLVSSVDLLYKVSNAVPTMADLTNGAIVCLYGEYLEVPAGEIWDGSGEGYPIISFVDAAFIALEDNIVNFDFPLPEKGVYFVRNGDIYATSLTIPGYTGFPVTKKIEEKYLPGAVILYADEEKYLYATEDTSDTSKRITKADLVEMVKSGRQVYTYLEMEGVKGLMTSVMVEIYSFDYAALQNSVGTVYYTAEYVPE